jgi:hypothetical protein
MLANAKELYASIEACASAAIRQEEDLIAHTRAIDQRERVVEELQEKL